MSRSPAAAALILGALCARAAPAELPAPLALSVEAERLLLPAGSVASVRLESLSKAVLLTAAGDPAALLQSVRGHSRLCPEATLRGKVVRLTCTTRRLDATLTDSGNALDLRVLRGLPWRNADDGPPHILYDPTVLDLGAACPGDTDAGHAECALFAGDVPTATKFFTAAAQGPHKAIASLRLGDLAIRQGDLESAISWYNAAGSAGPFGQLAMQRKHELLGGPRSSLHIDRSRLPEPLSTELMLREARVVAFDGKAGEAAQRVNDALHGAHPDACKLAEPLCTSLALAAMRSHKLADRADGLSLYVALPDRQRVPAAAELAAEAAEAAAALGAPAFGANALAATVSIAEPDRVEAHLLRAAELYQEAGQPVRRDVIVEYARVRLPAIRFAQRRWASLVQGNKDMTAQASEKPSRPDVAKELAAAEAAIAKARTVRAAAQPNEETAR